MTRTAPIEEQLYLLAVGLSLEEKIEKAIYNLSMYEHEAIARDPENGYYLCDSFGKDSCVILHLAQRAGVKFQAHHNMTTLDAPELMKFGREHHSGTIIHRPKVAMLNSMVEKAIGPPTRNKRWCCAEYKETAGNDRVKILGIRAAESAQRAKYWRTWKPNHKSDSYVLCPILFWTDRDVWMYLKEHQVPYCSLYDEGLDRLGCIGCPMSGKRRQKHFERWPGFEKAWKNAFRRYWNKWHGVPRKDNGQPRWIDRPGPWIADRGFESWEELWEWWMEELPEPDRDDCQMGLF